MRHEILLTHRIGGAYPLVNVCHENSRHGTYDIDVVLHTLNLLRRGEVVIQQFESSVYRPHDDGVDQAVLHEATQTKSRNMVKQAVPMLVQPHPEEQMQ